MDNTESDELVERGTAISIMYKCIGHITLVFGHLSVIQCHIAKISPLDYTADPKFCA